jgi:hypothetical protein
LLLLALVLWLGWTTAVAFRRVMLGPREVDVPPSVAPAAEPLQVDLLAHVQSLPREGHWSLAGWEWKVGQRQVSLSQVEVRLQQLAEAQISGQAAEPGRDTAIFAALEKLPLRRSRVENKEFFSLDEDKVRVRVVGVEGSGGLQLAAAAIALADEQEQWLLLELLPHSLPQTADRAEHLLPLPMNAQQLCARWTDDGLLEMEVYTVDCRARELIDEWEASGWEVRRNTSSASSRYSYLVSNGDRFIHAWGIAGHERLAGLVLAQVGTWPKNQQLDSGNSPVSSAR